MAKQRYMHIMCTSDWQNSAAGESVQQDNSASSPSSSSSVRRCPVLAAFYENASTQWSADRYIRLCSIVTTSRTSGGQRKRLVYTSTSNQLYIHVVNATADDASSDNVLLRYDGRCRFMRQFHYFDLLSTCCTVRLSAPRTTCCCGFLLWIIRGEFVSRLAWFMF